jgi:hypothetical protein
MSGAGKGIRIIISNHRWFRATTNHGIGRRVEVESCLRLRVTASIVVDNER